MAKNEARPPGFTLVELIIVMALLAVAAAFAAPMLGRSLRERGIRDEAARLLAVTEYSRAEAISQGVPMTLWLTPNGQRFGVEAKAGFDGDTTRAKEFALNPDISFQVEGGTSRNGVSDVIEFTPDGAPSSSSIDSIRLVDRFQSTITLARSSDGWAYEILKEQR